MIYLLYGFVFLIVFWIGALFGLLFYHYSLKLSSKALMNFKDGLPLLAREPREVEELQEFIGENT